MAKNSGKVVNLKRVNKLKQACLEANETGFIVKCLSRKQKAEQEDTFIWRFLGEKKQKPNLFSITS